MELLRHSHVLRFYNCLIPSILKGVATDVTTKQNIYIRMY
jgi:hypothetical protein